MKRKLMAQSVVTALTALTTGVAVASGFQIFEQNDSGLANAYAGSAAVADNASTIFFNPAGMTRLKGWQFSGGVAYIDGSFKFHDNGSSAGAFTGTGNGADAGTAAGVPNLYFSTELGHGFYAGLGIGAPFGLKTEYDVPWAGAAQATEFDVKTINLNPSIAYKVNEQFSVGAGVSYQTLDVIYRRQASTLTAFSLSQDAIKLDADDDTWGWNVGVLFEPSDKTRLGLSYRSRMRYHLTGDLQASGPTAALLAANVGAASADVTLPDTYVLSIVQTLNDKLEFLGDVSFTGWSSLHELNIIRSANNATVQTLPAHFKDTWRAALGVNYKISNSWKLKAGTAFDEGAAQSADLRLVSLPDNDRYWFSLGAQWTPSKAFTFDAGLAYINLRDADIDNDQRSANRGLVRGDYSSHLTILGAQASYAF